MKLFYYQDPGGNFGDDLNAWLWPRLIPELLDGDEGSLFVGIGSILDRRIPRGAAKGSFRRGRGVRVTAGSGRAVAHLLCARPSHGAGARPAVRRCRYRRRSPR